MKGDLHTLKKVCQYGSKVMMVGALALFAITVALLILDVGSLFSDACLGICEDITGNTEHTFSAVAELFCIFALASVTVVCIYRIMVSIQSEHSPFNEENTGIVTKLSYTYLGASVVLALLEALNGENVASALFMFFGCVLVAVVLYIFALIVRYGAVLQNESDHTL